MLLVTGASGFLGSNVLLEARDSGREIVGSFSSRPVRAPGLRAVEADLSTASACERLLDSLEPDWVLNCAALADVDACEKDPEAARRANVELPRSLAAACRAAGVRLAHVSTDSVFDGSRGRYSEADDPAPLNRYAASKLEGERAVQARLPDALVLRTNFVGVSPRGSGLADWVVSRLDAGERIPGFTDVVFSPLLANDLARILFEMMDARLSGVFHVAACDSTSKFDFAVDLARELGADESLVQQASLKDAALAAARPLDTSLDTSRVAQALGRQMLPVSSAIAGYAKLRAAQFAERLRSLVAA